MKPRIAVILVFAVAAICGGLWYGGAGLLPAGQEAPFLSVIREPQMDRIDLSGLDSKGEPFAWALVREPDKADGKRGGWILDGGQVGIERIEAVRFFQALLSLSPAHRIDDDEVTSKPEMFGLDRPELTITVHSSRPAERRFVMNFGKKHQFSGRRYLRLNNDKAIYLVEEQGFLAVKKQRSDLELKSPLRFDTSLVDRIEIIRTSGRPEEETISLVKKPAGGWTVGISGESADADSGTVTGLLSALSAQQAEDSVVLASSDDPRLDSFGTRQPKVKVSLHFSSDASPNPLVFNYGESSSAAAIGGKPQRQYFVQTGGSTVVFKLKQRPKQDLFQPVSYFWPRKPLAEAGIDSVAAVRITSDGKTASVGPFDPAASAKEKGQLQFLLDRLRGLEVITYDAPQDPASATQAAVKPLRIVAVDSSGAQIAALELVAPIDTGSAPDQASRFPPYSVIIIRANQSPLHCIVSGAEIELFRELYKRII